MLHLYNFKPAFGLISPSPFGTKAIALMKLSGLEFENRPGSLKKSPTGKLPLLQDGEKQIPDSTLIQYHLEEIHGVNFNESLSSEQIATARAFQSMCEEHLYWAGMYFRWLEDSDAVKNEFFGGIPALFRGIIFSMVLRSIKKGLRAHGLGRHDRETILKISDRLITAIADYMSDKPYFMGNKPHAIDATIYGFLSNVILSKQDSPLRDLTNKHPNLERYCNHFTANVMDKN
jgi:glutathione S-transferase